MIVNGIIAVIIAYLLGSISAAYIVTRLLTGKDIRRLGGGNAGARNTFREVGLAAAIPVAIFDVGKGAAAVAIASWLIGTSPYALFVLLAGLAVVAGHMWPVYLKFTGGNGLAAAIGVLALLLTRELVIVLALMLMFTIIIRNPVLSLNISLLSLPLSAFLLEKSWVFVIFAILLLLMMVLNFIPTARVGLARAGSREKLLAELLRYNPDKKKAK